MASAPPLIVSASDARRLESVLERLGTQHPEVARALEAELARAEIRASGDMPPDVVTMRSQAVCVDERTGMRRVLRLVYPGEEGAAEGNVSVLAPVGAALLGLSTGQSIEWPLPGGRSTRLTVVDVLYQPEAAGHPD